MESLSALFGYTVQEIEFPAVGVESQRPLVVGFVPVHNLVLNPILPQTAFHLHVAETEDAIHPIPYGSVLFGPELAGDLCLVKGGLEGFSRVGPDSG